MSTQEIAEEVSAWIQRMGKEYTRVYGPFAVWMRRVEEKGALDTKTKELISVALAVATQCKWCIASIQTRRLTLGLQRIRSWKPVSWPVCSVEPRHACTVS